MPLIRSRCKYAPRALSVSIALQITSPKAARIQLWSGFDRDTPAVRAPKVSPPLIPEPSSSCCWFLPPAAKLATVATICWVRISKGFSGIVKLVQLTLFHRRIPPRSAPDHPASKDRRFPSEWRPASGPIDLPAAQTLIVRGAPIWHTRSTWPMSMPSSREAVATTTGRSPDLSFSSTCKRVFRDMLPW